MEPGQLDHPDLEVTRLDRSAQSRRPRDGVARWSRTRAGRVTLSTLSALLVLGTLVGLTLRTTPDPGRAFTAAFGLPTATPTSPILLGGDTFILTGMVPWGTLTVDGRNPRLTDFPDMGAGFTLGRGFHHLVYRAQDFPTLRCEISVPVSTRDNCPLATNLAESAGALFQRFLDLQATPNHLIGPAYQSLVAAVDAQLAVTTATTTIQPGERYYSRTDVIVTARAPMTFTMGVKPAHVAMGDCQLYVCEVGSGDPASSQIGWQLETLVTPTWTVNGPDGVTFTSAIPQTQGFPVIDFAAAPSGSGWRVTLDGLDPLANAVDASAASMLHDWWPAVGQDTGLGFIQLANSADGVVLQLAPGGATVGATPNPAVQPEVLWRFGLMLTVNSAARRLLPHMPAASPAEQALARSAIVAP